MLDAPSIPLRRVRGSSLPPAVQECLRPGETIQGPDGVDLVLPDTFFEIPSWDVAMKTQLAPNFGVWELIDVDFREPATVRLYPRYIPCALAVLAGYLQMFRSEVGRVMRVAANGGYRSPAHRLTEPSSVHCWGTAVNIYRIGDEWLDTEERITRYAEVARRSLPAAWIRPYGEEPGYSFDHLHIDLGYLNVGGEGISERAPSPRPTA